MRGALWLLREHEGAVEADLQRCYQVDYRDRWHPSPSRRLTLRRLWVLVSRLPPDSATMDALRDGQAHWTIEAHLLDDVRMAVEAPNLPKGKKPRAHPSRPKPQPRRRADSPQRQMRLRAARRRAAERRRRREAGEL